MSTWLTVDEVTEAKENPEALRAICDEANAKLAEGIVLLARGEWRRGWELYQWRLRTEQYLRNWWRPYGCPVWRGEPLNGRRLLVHAEQGAGDCFQFCRYLPLIDGDVTFFCSEALFPIMLGVACPNIVTRADLGEYDRHVPLLSLPHVLGMGKPYSATSYVCRDSAMCAAARAALQRGKGPHVGFCWKGSPKHPNDARRSMTFEEIKQYAPAGHIPYALCDLDRSVTWEHTAALMSCLDVVISVDTAVAHLAGAMGVPVRLIIPREPEWRWASGASWYASMRITLAGKRKDPPCSPSQSTPPATATCKPTPTR